MPKKPDSPDVPSSEPAVAAPAPQPEAQPVAIAAPDAAPPPAPLLTAAEHAQNHGHTRKPRVKGDSTFTGAHMVADVVHGWSRHLYYKGEHAKLSSADYLSALEAAKAGKSHDAADFRKFTTFTKEEAKAKMLADLAETKKLREQKKRAKQTGPSVAQVVHQLMMRKAIRLAQTSGVKVRGSK
jgi:hypothetical protein